MATPSLLRSALSAEAMAAWRLLLPLLHCLLLLPSATSQDPSQELPGHVLPWASRENMVAMAPSSDPIKILVHLGYAKAATVESLAKSISDPKSPQYRKYLTREQFKDRFSPSSTFIARVSSWLESQGFTVLNVALNRLYIAAEGTVGVAERAFSVQLGMFRVGELTLRGSLNNPSIPSTLLSHGHTISILGLDQARALRNNGGVRAQRRPGWSQGSSRGGRLDLERSSPQGDDASASQGDTGCIWKDDSSYNGCPLTPSQIRAAYGIPPLLTGKNQSIGFVDWYPDPFIQSDLDKFSSRNGLKPTKLTILSPPFNTSLSQILQNPPLPPSFSEQSSNGEYSLDVQIAHGIAPDAKLVYSMAAAPFYTDLLAAVNVFLDFDLVSAVSMSWGQPLYGPYGLLSRNGHEGQFGNAAFVVALEALFRQAVIIGVGMYTSSGDDGTDQYSSRAGNYKTPNYPAASPWVTTVGGTALAVSNDTSQPWLFEAPWGNLYKYKGAPGQPDYTYNPGVGAGGGVANTFQTPFYQARFKEAEQVLRKSGFRKGRLAPDIAALGDPQTGVSIIVSAYVDANLTQNETQVGVYGGTSLASPLIAALVACAAEDAAGQGQPPFGFLAPTLYALKASAFHDITNRRLEVSLGASQRFRDATGFQDVVLIGGVQAGLSALRGFDLSTGRGSPSYAFIPQLVSFYAQRVA